MSLVKHALIEKIFQTQNHPRSVTWAWREYITVCPFTNFQPPNGPSPSRPRLAPAAAGHVAALWATTALRPPMPTPSTPQDWRLLWAPSAARWCGRWHSWRRSWCIWTAKMMKANSSTLGEYMVILLMIPMFHSSNTFFGWKKHQIIQGWFFCRESTWIYSFYVWDV